jgi:hypothetical protein
MSLSRPLWPSRIQSVPSWPTATSRIGDIGYLDQNGTWQKLINVFDAQSCRTFNVHSLFLPRPLAEYISETLFHSRSDGPLIKLSKGWTCGFLTTDELQ